MRVKSTCVNDVIETAILFLYLPIQPNSSFPSVVQHPFTNAPIAPLNIDGSMRMLDLMKPDDLQLWQTKMEQVVRKITDPMLLLSRISKGYRLAFSELLGNKLPSFLLQPPLLSNTKRITKSYTMSTSVRLG